MVFFVIFRFIDKLYTGRNRYTLTTAIVLVNVIVILLFVRPHLQVEFPVGRFTSMRGYLNTYNNKNEISHTKKLYNTTVDGLELIRQDCGMLCNTSQKGMPGPYFDHITAPVDCLALFKNDHIDKGHGLERAPWKIPKELLSDFTMNFRIPVSEWYFSEIYLNAKSKTPIWTEEMIEHYILQARNETLKGSYVISETNALRDGLRHASGVKNGRVLVIGSEDPWVEACALEAGAKEVVTLEYGEIKSLHPQIKAYTPKDFRRKYLNKTLGKFDAVITFSSVEHSGLGRYGDALNPWGDIIAIARAWCVTRRGGSLTIGVMYDEENDYLRFNAGRWYGKIRYPYLTTNWKQTYRGYGSQRIHVFVKK